MAAPRIPQLSKNGEAVQLGTAPYASEARSLGPEFHQHHWYAVYTATKHEKRVYGHLMVRDVTCFLPTYEVEHHWRNGCKVRLELPLFPNYLFVRIDIRERSSVLGVPGIHSIVGAGNKSLPLPDHEIESLRTCVHLRKCEPHSNLVEGQRVLIKFGPFENFTGVLVRKAGGVRVVISIDLIKSSMAVEVDEADVVPLHKTC